MRLVSLRHCVHRRKRSRRPRRHRAARAAALRRFHARQFAAQRGQFGVDVALGRGLGDRALIVGLTRREQETARRDLVRAGLWEECLRGIPPSLVARIRLDCLLTLLTEDVSPARATDLRGVDPERDVGAANDSPKSDSRLWHPRSLATPNPPRQFGPTREHGSPESAALLMNHSTGESLQPQNTGSPTPAPTC